MRQLSTLLLLAILGSGCAKLEKKEIVGQYSADRGYGLETLRLSENGQYEQKFVSGDIEITRSGRWSYFPETSNVLLHDVFIFDDGFGRQLSDPKTGGWSLGIWRIFGRTSLVYGEAVPFTELDI
jgi:hypothetical protein